MSTETSASTFSRIETSAAQTICANCEVPPLVLPRLLSPIKSRRIRWRGMGLIVMVASACRSLRRQAFASCRSFTCGVGKVELSRLASPAPFGIPSRVTQLIFPVKPLMRVTSVAVACAKGSLHLPLARVISLARSLR